MTEGEEGSSIFCRAALGFLAGDGILFNRRSCSSLPLSTSLSLLELLEDGELASSSSLALEADLFMAACTRILAKPMLGSRQGKFFAAMAYRQWPQYDALAGWKINV